MAATVLTVVEPVREWKIQLPKKTSIMSNFYGYRKTHGPIVGKLKSLFNGTSTVSYDGYFNMTEVSYSYSFDQVVLTHDAPVTGQVLVCFEHIDDLWVPEDNPMQSYKRPKGLFDSKL